MNNKIIGLAVLLGGLTACDGAERSVATVDKITAGGSEKDAYQKVEENKKDKSSDFTFSSIPDERF